jgi:hypothetical protein
MTTFINDTVLSVYCQVKAVNGLPCCSGSFSYNLFSKPFR